MNVYDFDGTIFRGDSTVRFYRYCLRRAPRLALRWPALVWAGGLYALGRLDKTAFKERFFAFLNDLPDPQASVDAFWAENGARIKAWYKAQRRADDLILSASPEFLLAPICAQLGAGRLIASRVDPRTGRYDGVNCGGEEKVRRYRAVYGDAPVGAFYSDSHADDPMARIAKKSYFVKGNVLSPWPRSRLTRAK